MRAGGHLRLVPPEGEITDRDLQRIAAYAFSGFPGWPRDIRLQVVEALERIVPHEVAAGRESVAARADRI